MRRWAAANAAFLLALGMNGAPDEPRPTGVTGGPGATPDAAPATEHRRALLIGVSRYERECQGAQTKDCIRPLPGALFDVLAMEALLRGKYGFETTVLATDQACIGKQGQCPTRARALDAMTRHVRMTRARDVLVIYWSGHGQRVKDYNGDEQQGLGEVATHPVEPPYDASVVPYDAGGDVANIVDDELYLVLNELDPDASNVTLIFDTCVSGDLAPRDVAGSRGPDWVPRFVEFLDDRRQVYLQFDYNRKGSPEYEALFSTPVPEAPYVVMTAVSARDVPVDRVSQSGDEPTKGTVWAFEREFDGVPRGVFTQVLWKELERVRGDQARLDRVFARVRREAPWYSAGWMMPAYRAGHGADLLPALFVDDPQSPRLAYEARCSRQRRECDIRLPPGVPSRAGELFHIIPRAKAAVADRDDTAIVRLATQRPLDALTVSATVERDLLPEGGDLVAVGFDVPFEYRRVVVHVDEAELGTALRPKIQQNHPFVEVLGPKSFEGGNTAADRCQISRTKTGDVSWQCGDVSQRRVRDDDDPTILADRLFPLIHEKELTQLIEEAAVDPTVFQVVDAKTGGPLPANEIEVGQPVRWEIAPPSDSCVIVANVGPLQVKGEHDAEVLNLKVLHPSPDGRIWPGRLRRVVATQELPDGSKDLGVPRPSKETTLAFFAPTREAAESVRRQLQDLQEQFEAWRDRQEGSASKAGVESTPRSARPATTEDDRIRVYKAQWTVVTRKSPGSQGAP